eukprot:scaffold177_cov334-Pavlova_lutheri.AAC.81
MDPLLSPGVNPKVFGSDSRSKGKDVRVPHPWETATRGPRGRDGTRGNRVPCLDGGGRMDVCVEAPWTDPAT